MTATLLAPELPPAAILVSVIYGYDATNSRVFVCRYQPNAHHSPPKRGRPRLHIDAAARQRSHRAKATRLAEIGKLKKESAQDDSKWFMPEAPHGKGLLITGGYGLERIETVDNAQIRDGKSREDLVIGAGGAGHAKHNEGHGPEADAPDEEIAFVSSKNWLKIFDERNRKPLRLSQSDIHLFCQRHSPATADTPSAFWDSESGAWFRLFAAALNKRDRAWILGCGCRRSFCEAKRFRDI
jgi:hypothetical protein